VYVSIITRKRRAVGARPGEGARPPESVSQRRGTVARLRVLPEAHVRCSGYGRQESCCLTTVHSDLVGLLVCLGESPHR